MNGPPVRNMLNAILDHQTTSVVMVDEALRVQYLNPAAEFLLAASFERARGESLGALLRDSESFLGELTSALDRSQGYTRRQLKLVTAAQHQRLTVDLTVTPLSDCESPALLLELLPVDRALRIHRETQQQRVQETTRELVRGLAHEIKNPLGGIRGAAQLLDRALATPELSEYTQIIIEEADRLRSLVDRMLGPNKTPKAQATNIHRLLERARQLTQAEHGEGLRFLRDYDPSLPELSCDPDQLMQALLNIVQNAAEALEHTERPTITLRTRALRQASIGQRRHRLVLRIDIFDNGPGVPAALADQLFYPMVSGRAEGTGLGLSIAQTIVGRHGGIIECDSHPGDTRFTISLPLEQPHDG